MTARTRVAAAAIASAFVVAGSVEYDMARDVDRADKVTAEVIHEDDPRWDCRVHGNRVCGPVYAVVRADGGVEVWGDGGRRPIAFVERERVAWEGEGDR